MDETGCFFEPNQIKRFLNEVKDAKEAKARSKE